MKRFLAPVVAAATLGGLLAIVVGPAPAGADGPIEPIYDCTITPTAPGGIDGLEDVPIPIDVTDADDPVAPGQPIEYVIDLDLPNVGDNDGLGLIGVMQLTIGLPRPGGLDSVTMDLAGTPNPPLAAWSSDTSGDPVEVQYQSPQYPNFNTGQQIQLQGDGDFTFPFGTENLVVPPEVTFEAVPGVALADSDVEWMVPTITAELAILGNQHDLECLPEVPATTVVTTSVCGAQAFSDVPTNHPFYCDIDWMDAQGISTGFEDGTFKPAAPVSRQAMSAFMFRFAGAEFEDPVAPSFNDVPVDHPFFTEIEWMADTGITTGFGDGGFHPSTAVSRQAMSAFMFRLAGAEFEDPVAPTFNDVPVDHPFFTEIEWMADTGVTTGFGDGGFHPASPVSRQAMAAFMNRLSTFLAE